MLLRPSHFGEIAGSRRSRRRLLMVTYSVAYFFGHLLHIGLRSSPITFPLSPRVNALGHPALRRIPQSSGGCYCFHGRVPLANLPRKLSTVSRNGVILSRNRLQVSHLQISATFIVHGRTQCGNSASCFVTVWPTSRAYIHRATGASHGGQNLGWQAM